MSNLIRTLALASFSIVLATEARADLITWGAPQSATGPLEVSLNGTLVTAKNLYSTSSSPTVNGVVFAAFAPTGWTNGTNLAMNGSTSGDAGYDTLMGNSRATSEVTQTNPTGWGGIRIDNLGTLTIGNTYEIQVWYCENRPGAGTGAGNTAINDRVMTMSSATGVATLTGGIVTNLASLTQGSSSAGVEGDPNNLSGAGDTEFGQFVTGTFTRTSTDQIWLLVQGTHPNATFVLRPNLNALQIREVPANTPVTYSCFGDGTGTACPCVNNGVAGNGCANSINANGANLSASGIASIAGDTWLLSSSGVPNGPGLYYQAVNLLGGGSGVVFGDGLRCIGGSVFRLGIVGAAGNASTYPSGATPPNNIPISVKGFVAPGTLNYQLWYRDSDPVFCSTSVFNLTNAVTVTWTP